MTLILHILDSLVAGSLGDVLEYGILALVHKIGSGGCVISGFSEGRIGPFKEITEGGVLTKIHVNIVEAILGERHTVADDERGDE